MEKNNQQGMSLWQLLLSIVAAFFGVRGDAARERDFSQGKLWQFIVIALLVVCIFLSLIAFLVSLVIRLAV